MRNLRRVGLAVWLGATALSAQNPSFHTVQKGETVFAIAKKYDLTTEQILRANPGLNPSRIHAGDRLRLPTANLTPSLPASPPASSPSTPAPAKRKEWVRVQKGDTLTKIARENQVTVEDLRRWNKLGSDPIRPGDKLRVAAVLSPAVSSPLKKTSSPAPPQAVAKKPAGPDWRFVGPARGQIDSPKDDLRDWEYIVVHHSGTSGGSAKVFDYYHSHERGMENGLAYHFVIGNGTDSGDGQIEVGHRWLKQLQGGHLASESLNEIAIGICLVGDFSRNRLGPRQTAALIELVKYLRQMMPGRNLKFRLHREINTRPTECPGRLFPAAAIHELLDPPGIR